MRKDTSNSFTTYPEVTETSEKILKCEDKYYH